MARIIPLTSGRHQETRLLLPWYLKGRLDAADLAKVEAHLRECADCQAELKTERRIDSAVAGMPLDVDAGWAEFRRRMAQPRKPLDRAAAVARTVWRGIAGPRGAPWAFAASAAIAVALVVLALPQSRPAGFRTLGAQRAPAVGDAIAIFRPEAREADVMRALRMSGARLVGGPTAADAYVLQVPMASRASALAKLRADPAVIMAEPLDPDGMP